MRINGDPVQLGKWNTEGLGPIPMKIGQEVTWLTGEKVVPWVYPVVFKHGDCPLKIKYKYSIMNDAKGEAVWEREPSRELDI